MLKKSQRKESRNIEMVDLNPQDGSEHFPESEDVPQVRECPKLNGTFLTNATQLHIHIYKTM